MLKRNLVANYLGQGWRALMGLVFIPVYIKYLGIEAYGLIGFYSVLQAWLALLDMGMTPTLNREMARWRGGGHSAESIRELLRTLEIITFCIALLIVGGAALSAGWMATSWLQSDHFSADVVTQAFMIMGLVTAMRFSETIYSSSLVGLQRQVTLNAINVLFSTARGLGAVAVLKWLSPTIQAFFVWQALLSLLSLICLSLATYAALPNSQQRSRFSFGALKRVWRFAGGVFSVTFLALLLTQIDKVLLSRLLNLGEYGYYMLGVAVAGALYMLINPISQAFYPRLCELHAGNDHAALANRFHQGAQLVSVMAGSVATAVIFFSESLLLIWTQDPVLAERVAPLLSTLMLGNLLNGAMRMPYHAQLAYGWTSLSVKFNAIAVVIVVPAILWVTPQYGAQGAAAVWVALNLSYLLIGVHFTFRRILRQEKWRWYFEDLIAPLAVSSLICTSLAVLWSGSKGNLENLMLLLMAVGFSLLASALSTKHTRQKAVALLGFLFLKAKCILGR